MPMIGVRAKRNAAMAMGRILIVFVLVAGLGACASYKMIWQHGGGFSDAHTSAFRFSGANRDFRTSVVGNPFDVPMKETESAVIAAMQGQDKGLNTNFTVTPRTGYKNDHIVMMFNPPHYYADRTACRSTAADHAGKNRHGEMVLAAIYCDGDRLVFAVAASHAPISSPRDREFRRFVSEIMDFFVPQHSMTDDRGNEGDN
jgi:hypothetical protein